jgi:MSHA biogenesis protein MshQ
MRRAASWPRPVVLVVLLAVLALLAPRAALADTPIRLFKTFAGNVNLTGTEKSLRTRANNVDACATATSVTLNLNTVPTGATVLAAYLYWAGSGATADYTVTFNGKSVSAPATRRYASTTVGYNYFSGAADVSDQVRGNGNYTASGLDIDKSLFCSVQGVLGGFQLLVIYSQSQEIFRVLNVYEGFQYIRNSSVELTLANFQTPNPIGNLTARVGHITWEGDDSLSGGGETLRYNGVEQTDSLNPPGNQFNSVSSVNGDTASYGLDFDAYTVKYPVIDAGQRSAKTTYTSGQDLVLLNAEVIAAPNVPATDRGVQMTLNGNLVPSAPTTYTISVVNNGPMNEGGPVTVTGTLPASLIYGGATGSGWTCNAQGQLLTCTYSGVVNANTTLPPITLTVTPAASATGLITFGVTVGGKLFDYYDGNDTSTVSARVGNQTFTPVFLFTTAECQHNRPFGHPQQTCEPLTLDFRLANTDISTWITYTVNGVPTALASTNTTIPMRFALSCHDPVRTAGVKASYFLRSGTLTIPTCEPGGAIPAQNSAAWSTVSNILYPGGSPSSRATTATTAEDPTDFLLRYQDVGRIEFFVTDNIGRLGSTGAFVSRPERLLLLAQSSNKAGDPASAADPRFVPAGSQFTMSVRALMYDLTTPAPNFGNETEPEKIALTVTPATTADGSPIAAMVTRSQGEQPAPAEIDLGGGFAPFAAGIATGSGFTYDDVGVIRVQARLARSDEEVRQNAKTGSYLGTGDVVANYINVGRFYPAWLETVVQGTMDCVEAARCPKDPALPQPPVPPLVGIDTMVYSGQPFKVTVSAKNSKGRELPNYRLELAREVTLSPWTAPNGDTAQRSPSSTTLAGTTYSTLTGTTVPASAFTAGVATVTGPTYTFPAALAYTATAPAANNWPQPVSVYVRALESGGTDQTTSKRAAAVEGGVNVIAGRAFVPSQQGAATLAMSVPVSAEFFGTLNGVPAWYKASTDSASTFAPAANVSFSTCTPLKGTSRCSVPVTVDRTTSGAFSSGIATVKLNAPGSGSSGNVEIWLTGPAWLPSVHGVLTYGTVTTRPYTYLREMY